jgi:hypothetical protein
MMAAGAPAAADAFCSNLNEAHGTVKRFCIDE